MKKSALAVNFNVEGRFKFVARKDDGSERLVADWFENLILDAGLNRMGTGNFLTYAHVGTNNTAPANGQTTLVAQVASTNNLQATTSGYDSAGNSYVWVRHTYRFGLGAAAGNLAEVGVGWSSTLLYSRALIKDAGGTPTTVTVLADEYLDVIYEWRVYIPTADITFDLDISGVTYSCVLRAADISSNVSAPSYDWGLYNLTIDIGGVRPLNLPATYTGTIGAVTAEPSGFIGTGQGSTTAATYVNNSYERLFTSTWSLTQGSSAIRSVVFRCSLGKWQCQFTPTIPKTAANVLTLNWKMSWSRRTL